MTAPASIRRPLVHLTPEPAATSYPEHYATRFVTMDGSSRIASHLRPTGHLDTVTQAWIKDRPAAHLAIVQMAPDGKPVTSPNWAGGTWGDLCGSTAWFIDATDRRDSAILMRALGQSVDCCEFLGMDSKPSDERSPAWWVNGLRGPADGWDGFRVHCDEEFRHDGACRNGAYTWVMNVGLPVYEVPA